MLLVQDLYTTASITAVRNAAIAYFNVQFGLNFSTGFVDPTTGIIALPSGFIMVPYRSGKENSINVAYDSANLLIGELEHWYGYQFGELIVPEVSGVFSGGVHAGDAYVAGDIFTYFQYNLVGPLGLRLQRIIITAMSPWAGKTVVNSQGYGDFYAKLTAYIDPSSEAYYHEGIEYIKVNGITYRKTRVVITWPLV